MSDDRSERLRNRRKRASEKAKQVEEDNEVKPDKTDKPDNEVTPVKERDGWGPIQMHLPDDLRSDLDLEYQRKNIEMQEAGEEQLKKLLHWYPLVVYSGLERIQEMDRDELQEWAEEFESWD